MSRIVPVEPHEAIDAAMRVQLEEAWPNTRRLLAAFRLALDVDTCSALLRGEPVDPDRLHRPALVDLAETRMVRLASPLELLEAA